MVVIVVAKRVIVGVDAVLLWVVVSVSVEFTIPKKVLRLVTELDSRKPR